jgi:hypothetical protein
MIRANGAAGGVFALEPLSNSDWSAEGGAGSGGGIRIVASRLAIAGSLLATGALECLYARSGSGRIRLEADVFGPLAPTSPQFTASVPGPLFPVGQLALRFSSIAGIPVPASPTGSNDVTVPTATANPVTLALATSGVPVGSILKVSIIPQFGAPISVNSPPTVGSLDNATTSVSVAIPTGHSVLSAQISYTVVAAAGDALSRFAQGERVEKVTLTSALGQAAKATLHTATGRQFDLDPALLTLAAMSQ